MHCSARDSPGLLKRRPVEFKRHCITAGLKAEEVKVLRDQDCVDQEACLFLCHSKYA